MSKVIHKFSVGTDKHYRILMPAGAEILHVNHQLGYVKVWALIDPDAPMVKHQFSCYMTGQEIVDGPEGKYLGTVHIDKYGIVIHVYDEGELL